MNTNTEKILNALSVMVKSLITDEDKYMLFSPELKLIEQTLADQEHELSVAAECINGARLVIKEIIDQLYVENKLSKSDHFKIDIILDNAFILVEKYLNKEN